MYPPTYLPIWRIFGGKVEDSWQEMGEEKEQETGHYPQKQKKRAFLSLRLKLEVHEGK